MIVLLITITFNQINIDRIISGKTKAQFKANCVFVKFLWYTKLDILINVRMFTSCYTMKFLKHSITTTLTNHLLKNQATSVNILWFCSHIHFRSLLVGSFRRQITDDCHEKSAHPINWKKNKQTKMKINSDYYQQVWHLKCHCEVVFWHLLQQRSKFHF